jgi:mono/diheme cytochrome c family protein
MHRAASSFFLAWLGMWLPAGTGPAAEPAGHPVVPGFERFHAANRAGSARGGQLLLGELGCVACHKPAENSTVRKQAPVLDFVGARVRVSYLKQFLRDPHAVKPGTTMPNLFTGDPDADKKIEALVHLLASTGTPRQERPDRKLIGQGRDLFHKVGCVACHGTRDAAGNADKVLATSVPLGDPRAKYSLISLAIFLEQPHQARPSGRMPRLLDGKEAKAVANYLLQGLKVDLAGGKGATRYAYYEGGWPKLPDFSRLKPKETGTAAGFELNVARRDSNYALKFEGFFKAERDANYTFTLTSDDGSRLLIDGKQVVNNDGTHPPQTVRGSTRLTKGVHQVTVLFFQGGGGAELSVQIEAPGYGQHDLGDIVAVSEEALRKKPAVKKTDPDALDIQPALVEQGRLLFASTGCASCHRLNDGRKTVDSTFTAPALAKLKPEGGCLSASPAKKLPRYFLSDSQRKALAAALKSPPAPAKKSAEIIAQTMLTFNCNACHERNKVGGPEELVNKSFQTTQPEMGDEARVPPPLDGAGGKLNPEYLRGLLDRGVHDRPYMHTRMPGFGNDNVGQLVEAFGDVDKTSKVPAVTFKTPLGKVKTSARFLVGNQAFGCIKCHTFGGKKAEGTQGIDMTLMTRRLKHDWFRAYVEDPQRFRPGTRMPSAFMEGKSQLPNILGGTADNQLEAIWLYLSDSKARPPVGMLAHSIPLVPSGGAIIYRNFIQGAGTRAIGVGYPEKANLAFDANEMRLAMLWQGAFMDAGRHWSGRGEGFEGPLGDDILHLHAGAPFAILASGKDAWPKALPKTMGYRFLGYRLTSDDRPTFRYALNGITFEDFCRPEVTGQETHLRRTLTISSAKPVEDLYYRAAVGSKIEDLGKGWYRIDGAWKLKIEGGAGQVRQSAGKTELLVPIRFKDGKAQLVQVYSW